MKRLMSRKSAGMSLSDLLVVAVLIPLVSVVMLGCYRSRGESAVRVKCAANLKSIGQAMMLYANDNRGAYPRTRYTPGEKVIPTWATGAPTTQPFASDGPEPNDVTAAIFLLLTTQDGTPEAFICPQSDAERWDFGGGANTAANWSNWNGRDVMAKHLSYSMQNPYFDDAAISRGAKWNQGLGADFAVFADINPGTTRVDANVLTVKPDSGSARRRGNSRNHNSDGQNVLYGDGHVDFTVTPFAGVSLDNIYARRAGPEGSASSDVRNSPFDGSDNVLLPTDD